MILSDDDKRKALWKTLDLDNGTRLYGFYVYNTRKGAKAWVPEYYFSNPKEEINNVCE